MGPVSMFQQLLGMWGVTESETSSGSGSGGGTNSEDQSTPSRVTRIQGEIEEIQKEVQDGNFTNAGKLLILQVGTEDKCVTQK